VLARLIGEATEALARLDPVSLNELASRAESLMALDLGGAGVNERVLVPVLEHRLRLFGALLKATGDNLATLRRAESQQTYGAESFGGRGQGAGGALPLNGYGAPRGLFESFGLYSDEEEADSIWPRGRLAQQRARLNAAGGKGPGTRGSGPA
jgi:hypothetical protein